MARLLALLVLLASATAAPAQIIQHHDYLAGFVSEEHLRWDQTGAETVHADRIAAGSVDDTFTVMLDADDDSEVAFFGVFSDGDGLAGSGAKFAVTEHGYVWIGPVGTEPTGSTQRILMFNRSWGSPSSLAANTCAMWSDDVTQEIYCMNEAGVESQLTGQASFPGGIELHGNDIKLSIGPSDEYEIYRDSTMGTPALVFRSTTGLGNILFDADMLTDRWTHSTSNTLVGVEVMGAGNLDAGGIHNVGISFRALRNITTGDYNVCIGTQAGEDITTQSFNTLIGAYAGQNVTGSENTIIGTLAFRYGAAESYNTIIGSQAVGASGTSASYTTAIGNNALLNYTDTGNMTVIGQNGGRYLLNGSTSNTGGNQCTWIGEGVRAVTTDDQNSVVIGYMGEGKGSNTTVIGNSSTTDAYVWGTPHWYERASDPSDPGEGEWVMWMSDGTGAGDDGDIMFKITAGATTKSGTLLDFSTF